MMNCSIGNKIVPLKKKVEICDLFDLPISKYQIERREE